MLYWKGAVVTIWLGGNECWHLLCFPQLSDRSSRGFIERTPAIQQRDNSETAAEVKNPDTMRRDSLNFERSRPCSGAYFDQALG